MKYGLIFASRKTRELWERVSWESGIIYLASRNYIVRRKRELTPHSCRVLSTFWVEAAVLILVFPPLEFFLARRSINEGSRLANGTPPIGMASVWQWSGILCIAFLVASIIFSEWASRKGEDDKEE